tara:strand:- start:1148 stop:1297 length:150 start_codon:yes stop_codon:yes gene_type:complete
MDTVDRNKYERLDMLVHKQGIEIKRLSNAIERISIAMTAVRMNESKGKK